MKFTWLNTEGSAVIKQGICLYDETVVCDIRIVRTPIWYGTGDCYDSREIAEDRRQECYHIEYGSTTERGVYNSSASGFASLAEAIENVKQIPGTGSALQWID